MRAPDSPPPARPGSLVPPLLQPARGVADGWEPALLEVDPQIAEALAAVATRLDGETAAGRPWLPDPTRVLRVLEQPLDRVRVLIVGQDPYPTPGHPVGLAFSADSAVRPLPKSLANIARELTDDVGAAPLAHADLSAWAERGVLLLNRVLTVEQGRSGAHRAFGWQRVSDAVVRALVARGGPLVAILWGRDAQAVRGVLGDVPAIESAHPSPLSAHRGFVGSRPFSRANALLVAQGGEPVEWDIDA